MPTIESPPCIIDLPSLEKTTITMRPDGPRDPVVGPDDGPQSPFPLRLNGKVIKGFGRGSAEVSRDSFCFTFTFHRRHLS